MAIFKCKMCGGNLDVETGSNIQECPYCGTKQTVPSIDDEKKIALFSRANRLRLACEFDKAAGVYESIVSELPEEAEAYWGLVLCKYGIEYVDDPATGKKVPTCHRSSFDSVLDDANFEMVMENATVDARVIYREEAKQIEELRKGIIEVSSKEEPYDIFICYKETAENGERTIDSVIAQDVYTELTSKGYREFFTRNTLEDKLGQEYEPYIFAALNSAKVMLVFGTDYEYFNAVWVKNEWSRFLQLIAKGEKKTLIPCYKDIDAYDMPKEFAKLQAQDFGKVGAVQDLLRGVEKILEKKKTDNIATKQNNEKKLIDDAFSFLEDGSFKMAEKYANNVLKTNPQNVNAYVIKLMAELKIKHFTAKDFSRKNIKNNQNYKKAIECGDKQIIKKFEEFKIYKKKSTIKKISISLASSFLVAVIGVISYIAICSAKYEEYLLAFQDETMEYSQLETKFARLLGYKDSESYRLICGIKSGKVYDNVHKVKYDTLLETEVVVLSECFPNVKIIEIQDDITTITANAFAECVTVKEIKIPDSVTYIASRAFYNCNSLTSITIPDSVTSIESKAFYNCTSLTSITISDSVTSIESRAFYNCTSLTSITIPDSVTSIKSYAFYNCTALNKITIPDSVTSIGAGAFNGCSSLESIVIPKSVEKIGDSVFADCKSLKTIYCEVDLKPSQWGDKWVGTDAKVVYNAKK